MNTVIGSRITGAIGVMAIVRVAISSTGTWAAQPIKQEKNVKKSAQTQTTATAKKATAPKFASAERAGKAHTN